jgi:hypothetical protein
MRVASPLLTALLVASCSADAGPGEDLARPATSAATLTPPTVLAPAFRYLESALIPGERDALRGARPDGRPDYQYRLSRLVGPTVEVWPDADLAEAARWGVHPEDLGGVVLDAYAQSLRGEPVDLAAAIARRLRPPVGYEVLMAPVTRAP